MQIKTKFPYVVVEHADIGIQMSDGCRLSARVWMPEGVDNHLMPAILEHLPYRKRDGTIARDEITQPWFAGHGYVCIRTDMRGNGESEGVMTDEYTAQELADAIDVIKWAANQPWCNGRVGMMGISWGGFNSLQVAALQPEALKAIITVCSTVDRYADDIHYKGGCLLGENFGWASNMLAYSSRPPDPVLVGDQWRARWLDRLEKLDFHLSVWLRHQHRTTYWQHGSVCEDYSAIKAAVLTVGGWHDGYRNTISHLVENLSAPVKGIVGPWIHKYPHYAKPEPAIGFLQEAKRWWDQYLKEDQTGVESDPAYRAYLMDSVKPRRWLEQRPGRWIAEEHWPSANITTVDLHLGDNGVLSTQPTQVHAIVTSPLDCGAGSGEYFPFAFSDELPDEQSADDAGSTCFDSELQTDAIDIVGAPSIQLLLSSDKPVAQLAVRLLDLRPDGTSALITFGVLNLTHVKSHAAPEELTPDKPFNMTMVLDQIAYRVPSGHRLRIALSNAYWPLIWPSPEVTTLTILDGKVSLPARPTSSGDECQFEVAEGSEPWKTNVLRPASYERATHRDDKTGMVSTNISNDFGENEDLQHGLISGGWTKECWSIRPDDPLSAKVTILWQHTGGREGSMWRTDVSSEMHSDQTHFHFQAKLQAFENNEIIVERVFSDSIERDLV